MNILDEFGRLSWDYYFISMCFLISQRSIDPSTKHGCIVTDTDHTVLSMGYNSCPRHCNENAVPLTRPYKYAWMVHAEEAAIANAARSGISLNNSTFYITGVPCERCLRSIINSGAIEIVYGMAKCSNKCDTYFEDIINSCNLPRGQAPWLLKESHKVTSSTTGVKKLLNLTKEISYVGVSPQLQPLRQCIKQFRVVGTVCIALNLWISEREEVGFSKYSELGNTHNPNTQGGLKPCMCM